MSREDTRAVLIETGRRMMFETGFNHTGIQAVLAAAEVPKGSFYYYFGSKDEFGLAVLEDFLAGQRANQECFLGNRSLSPLARLRAYFNYYTERFEKRQFEGGCLLGNLSQEMSDQSETFRTQLAEAFEAWRAKIEACLREAKEAGEIAASEDERVLADFLLSSWQGAILRMKVTRSRAPLDTFASVVFGSLCRV